MAKLDDLLSSSSMASDPGADSLRATVFAELEVAPARSWRGDVLLVIGVGWLAFLAAAAGMFAAGQLEPALVWARLFPLTSLLVVSGFCAFAALAPRRQGRLIAGFVVALIGLVGLVVVRGEGHPSSAAPWVCTIGHLALGAGPLVLMLALLRKSALGAARAALAGLAIGAIGAMLGEVGCGQGWAHVAVWHLGAWLGLAVAALLVSRRLMPRSFAP